MYGIMNSGERLLIIGIINIQFWDANVSPSTGTSITVTPKAYFSGMNAGGTLNLGFQLAFAGSTVASITSITVTLVGVSNCRQCYSAIFSVFKI
jgi:hypothetical protein